VRVLMMIWDEWSHQCAISVLTTAVAEVSVEFVVVVDGITATY
jgi:hypothetical protein